MWPEAIQRKQELQALVATEIRQNTTSKHATRPNVMQSAARSVPDEVAIESLNSDQPGREAKGNSPMV